MMQEHPFFSTPQIFYGKPIEDEEMDEEEEVFLPWNISIGEIQTKPDDQIGLFFFWSDSSSMEGKVNLQ